METLQGADRSLPILFCCSLLPLLTVDCWRLWLGFILFFLTGSLFHCYLHLFYHFKKNSVPFLSVSLLDCLLIQGILFAKIVVFRRRLLCCNRSTSLKITTLITTLSPTLFLCRVSPSLLILLFGNSFRTRSSKQQNKHEPVQGSVCVHLFVCLLVACVESAVKPNVMDLRRITVETKGVSFVYLFVCLFTSMDEKKKVKPTG